MYTLEEFPPRREPREPEPDGKRKKSRRPRRPSLALSFSWLPFAALLAIGVSAGGAGAFWWAERKVTGLEGALADARIELETAHNSLQLLWATTTRLDEARGRRQDFLRDSLASVQQFVDTEVTKLWQTAYLEHRERLDSDAARIAANRQSIGVLLDESSTTNSRIDALFDENENQYASLRDLGAVVNGLRQTLAAVSGRVDQFEQQTSAARIARGQLDRRVGGVELWIDGFTAAGLDGGVVDDRLAMLVAELEEMTARVDSLRVVTDSVRRSRALVGPPDPQEPDPGNH